MFPLRDSEPTHIFPFWIIAIILLNFYIFYLEITSTNPDSFIAQFSVIANQLNFLNPQSLTPLITSQFVHAGFIHIISNMLFLWVFGDKVEEAFGFFIFPIFYLSSGVIAALSQYYIAPQANIPMLGASGAVAGVLGAYLALFPTHRIKTLLVLFIFITVVEIPAYLLLIYWFFTQLFDSTAALSSSSVNMGGIAFFAHIGGFIFGFLMGKINR